MRYICEISVIGAFLLVVWSDREERVREMCIEPNIHGSGGKGRCCVFPASERRAARGCRRRSNINRCTWLTGRDTSTSSCSPCERGNLASVHGARRRLLRLERQSITQEREQESALCNGDILWTDVMGRSTAREDVRVPYTPSYGAPNDGRRRRGHTELCASGEHPPGKLSDHVVYIITARNSQNFDSRNISFKIYSDL